MSTTESNSQHGSLPGTPSLLRAINDRALLDYLRKHGPTSRAQLARITGLSKPTVSQALAGLEGAGLVRPVGQISSSKGGRFAVLYESNPEVGYVLGVDVGRRWVRVAVADLAGQIVVRNDKPNTADNASTLVALISDLAHELVSQACLSWSQMIYAVIGTPGVRDLASNRMLFSANLPEWGKSGILAELRAALDLELAVENDANLAALGERTFGWGAAASTFVYLMVGTGIGMGIILHGTLYRGARGTAGEVGFLPIDVETAEQTFEDAYSSESYLGMFEEAASAKGILRLAQDAGLPDSWSTQQVFLAAAQGDERALAVVGEEGRRLAWALATVAAVLDPELVVLGGGIGQRIELLQEPLERELARLTPLRPRIVPPKLGDDSILLGAIATALEIAHDAIFQRYFHNH